MTLPETTNLPSIQGERFKEKAPQQLSLEEVDEYVDNHSEEVVDCRMTMRHVFPRPRRGQIPFTEVLQDGTLVAPYTCSRCGCATRYEYWTPVRTRRGGQNEWRYEFAGKTLVYHKNEKGETYLLPPGSGKGRPTEFRESMMTQLMRGQSPAAMRKAIEQMQAERG